MRILAAQVTTLPIPPGTLLCFYTDGLIERPGQLESAAHGPGAFVVDLTRTQFCDTSGLHALVGAHKRARAGGGDMPLGGARADPLMT